MRTRDALGLWRVVFPAIFNWDAATQSRRGSTFGNPEAQLTPTLALLLCARNRNDRESILG